MIIIQRKPESVSWDEIHEVIFKAHSDNRAKGIDIRNAHLSGDDIKQSLGHDGVCFVALDNDRVVATSSVSFQKLNTWYAREQMVAYITLQVVLQEYRGMHLYSELEKRGLAYAKSIGCSGAYKKIAEKNKLMRSIARRSGYFEVSIGRTSFNPDNYVTSYKWLGDRKCSATFIRLKYWCSWTRLKMNLLLGRTK